MHTNVVETGASHFHLPFTFMPFISTNFDINKFNYDITSIQIIYNTIFLANLKLYTPLSWTVMHLSRKRSLEVITMLIVQPQERIMKRSWLKTWGPTRKPKAKKSQPTEKILLSRSILYACPLCQGTARPFNGFDGRPTDTVVNCANLDIKNALCYLGDMLSFGGGCYQAIKTRCSVAWGGNFENFCRFSPSIYLFLFKEDK